MTSRRSQQQVCSAGGTELVSLGCRVVQVYVRDPTYLLIHDYIYASVIILPQGGGNIGQTRGIGKSFWSPVSGIKPFCFLLLFFYTKNVVSEWQIDQKSLPQAGGEKIAQKKIAKKPIPMSLPDTLQH